MNPYDNPIEHLSAWDRAQLFLLAVIAVVLTVWYALHGAGRPGERCTP